MEKSFDERYFVNKLKELIQKYGYSVPEIVQISGVNENNLFRSFSRESLPRFSELISICNSLGIEVESFFKVNKLINSECKLFNFIKKIALPLNIEIPLDSSFFQSQNKNALFRFFQLINNKENFKYFKFFFNFMLLPSNVGKLAFLRLSKIIIKQNILHTNLIQSYATDDSIPVINFGKKNYLTENSFSSDCNVATACFWNVINKTINQKGITKTELIKISGINYKKYDEYTSLGSDFYYCFSKDKKTHSGISCRTETAHKICKRLTLDNLYEEMDNELYQLCYGVNYEDNIRKIPLSKDKLTAWRTIHSFYYFQDFVYNVFSLKPELFNALDKELDEICRNTVIESNHQLSFCEVYIKNSDFKNFNFCV